MGVAHSGLANRFFDVRYMHLVSGRTDLPNHAFRIKAFLKAIKRKSARRQKIPCSIDLLSWLYHNWFGGANVAESQICSWAAISIGGFLLYAYFRNSELKTVRSVFLSRRCITTFAYFFAKSKNDQGGIGISRTLADNNNVISPVRGLSQW